MSILTEEKIKNIVWVESVHKPTKTPIYHGYFPNLRYNKRNIKQEGNSAVCRYSLGIKNYSGEYLKVSEVNVVKFNEEQRCRKCMLILQNVKLKK